MANESVKFGISLLKMVHNPGGDEVTGILGRGITQVVSYFLLVFRDGTFRWRGICQKGWC